MKHICPNKNTNSHKFQLTKNLPLSLIILFIIKLGLLQRFCISIYKRKEKEELFFTPSNWDRRENYQFKLNLIDDKWNAKSNPRELNTQTRKPNK